MARNRTKLAFLLVVLMTAHVVIDLVLVSARAKSNRLAFDKLQKEMTITETFDLLNQSPDKWIHEKTFMGIAIDDYRYESEWWVFPRYEYKLSFFGGRLVTWETQAAPFAETWRELRYEFWR